MHIHILGICGTFMGGVAAIAREAGHRVTGCDENVYPPMSDQLRRLGVDVIEGYSTDQLAISPDRWVIGNVVSRGNPLMEAILDSRQSYISGPQWLAEEVLRDRWVLAVAGTHGKTTTAAMLAWILEIAGCAPGFLIGGAPVNFPFSARLGRAPYFVIEADEYDTAFFDKRSKFLHYRPKTLVVNNLEFDHADIFPDLTAMETQFHHLMRVVPSSGRVIYSANAPALQRVFARGMWCEASAVGAESGWQEGEVTSDGSLALGGDWNGAVSMFGKADQLGCRFEVRYAGTSQGECQMKLIGEHNRMNALFAIAAAEHVGIVPSKSKAAFETFLGVRRRLEYRGMVGGVHVFDDFAHHPTAIAQTLLSLRQYFGQNQRILAVWEPRSRSMKQGVFSDQLPESFQNASHVFAFSGGITWDLEQVLAPLGEGRVTISNEMVVLTEAIVRYALPGDCLVVMSNGDFQGIHNKLLERLGQPENLQCRVM